jgi:hypothetical protein
VHPKIDKALIGTQLTEQEQNDFVIYLANIIQKFPELCQFVKVWSELSIDVRQKIINLIGKSE